MVLNEVIEEAKRKKWSRLIFKVDFAKAYDSVEWNFLDEIMAGMNFGTKWRKWILECISTAYAAVLVNGSPSPEFKLERGLRQGDPLSPFLFLIIAEGLNILVSKAVQIEMFEALDMGREKVKVVLLQYADDTIFTCTGKMENVLVIKDILRNFELLSGLKVNFNKCSLVGLNTSREIIQQMADALGCEVGQVPFSYLGLKVGINHRRDSSWKNLVDKIRRRLDLWNDKHISLGGRITLVQAVLSAVPIYCLSFFRLPKKILREIVSIQRKFLWGVVRTAAKFHGLNGLMCVKKRKWGAGN